MCVVTKHLINFIDLYIWVWRELRTHNVFRSRLIDLSSWLGGRMVESVSHQVGWLIGFLVGSLVGRLQLLLGFMYLDGEGTHRTDNSEAVKW